VTDSGAAGTALAAGFKTNNGMIGVLPDGQPVGSIMEAAKMDGYLTALVVTSIINHATPAAFSSHSASRNALPQIAEQQIGYSHPLNQSVDILLGGGRCYFKPNTSEDSCREDDIDLLEYAEKKGYYVAQDRAEFDQLEKGRGRIQLPYIGLFNDDDLVYDIDRKQQPESEREPSLTEMAETALESLKRGVECRGRKCPKDNKGYFIMIEASRIDHSSHAHDGAAHVGDALEYLNLMDFVKNWIDQNPDTMMISVSDHETGGLTLPEGYNVNALAGPTQSVEHLTALWEDFDGSDRRGFLTSEIFPTYGITNATDAEVSALLSADDEFGQTLADTLNSRSGLKWSTGGHTGCDTTLFGYAKGKMGDDLKLALAGNHDNTEIPRFIGDLMQLDMDKVTEALRAEGTDWIP
jgi:alkaline phosphatase